MMANKRNSDGISMALRFCLLFCLTELDDGKNYRKPLDLMVKTMVSVSDFPLNQSIDCLNGGPGIHAFYTRHLGYIIDTLR